MTANRSLFNAYPRLKDRLPFVELADLPTPITRANDLAEELGVGELYIKRDDLSGEFFGGNKVRKLEFLLGKALAEERKEVMTFGYAGSNHALATALYTEKLGLRSISMLLPQPNACYVRRNLLASHAAGAELHLYPSEQRVAAGAMIEQCRHLLKTGRRPMLIPPGGSAPLGILGFVNAAFELAHQIKSGVLPTPDVIYLPLGSLGSSVGLALGLNAAGIDTPITGISVTPPKYANPDRFAKLVRATLEVLLAGDADFPEISIEELPIVFREEFLGEGYARFTEAGMQAVRLMNEALSLPLDGTYSGKCFSALIADAHAGALEGKKVLFWNTHNSRDFSDRYSQLDYRELPKAFHPIFEQDLQPLDTA